MSTDRDRIADYVCRIESLPAAALAGFIADATGMLARGEVAPDFGDFIEVALERLDQMEDDSTKQEPALPS